MGVMAISKGLLKSVENLTVVLLENGISRVGMFAFDRQIGDATYAHHLPLLKTSAFHKVATVEVTEIAYDKNGNQIRQLGHLIVRDPEPSRRSSSRFSAC